MDSVSIVYGILAAALVCAVAIPLLAPLARRIGLMDHPGGRKRHRGAVPLTGGLAIYLGLVTAVAMQPDLFRAPGPLLAGAGLLLIVGVIDDIFELRAVYKLLAQIAAAAIMVGPGANRISGLSNLFYEGPLLFGPFGDIFTIVATLAMINAVNMSDGIDGLAGSLCAVTLTALGFAAWYAGLSGPLLMIGSALACVLVFLFFNARHPLRPPTPSFLGDSGSMVCGFVVAWFLVELAKTPVGAINSATVLWIAAVPVMDLTVVMFRRIYKGRSPFSAGREHLHHLLQAAGFSCNQIIAIIAGYAAVLAVIGMTTYLAKVPEPVMFYSFFALGLVNIWILRNAWRAKKTLRRLARR